jgi:adenylate cyclase
MKRCPTCNLVETDDALRFCRADGTTLIDYPGPIGAEAGTARFDSAPISGEIETSILPHTSTTPEISRSTGPTTALPAPQKQNITRELIKPKRRGVVFATVGLVVIVIAAAGYFYWSRNHKTAIESIAVMPFVNESGNADVEYLSDGMTETLISSLSQLPNLNVRPRSSVFRYKGKETDPQTIGKELNAQAILNGKLVQRGQDLSLFVELIDVALDKVVWSQRYDRKQTDIVTLQTDVARDVSNRLKTKLTGEDEAKVTKTYTANPEAYQLYLKGNYYEHKYNQDGYKKAIEYYEQAIEKDPNYALAYVGMGNAYITASGWYLAPNEAMPKAKTAGLKALDHDNSLADAYRLLGIYEIWYGLDWVTCERNLRRAIELGSTTSHDPYAFYLTAMGNIDQAITEFRLSQSLNPLNLDTNASLAFGYIFASRYDEAIEQARKTIELDPSYWRGHELLGLAYERKRQYPEAIAALEKARTLDSNPEIMGYLGYVYAVSGKTTEAKRVLDELKRPAKTSYSSLYVAYIYAGLNDKDKTFEWLNKAVEERGLLSTIKVDPPFENLRGDPRFKDLSKRLNLPE